MDPIIETLTSYGVLGLWTATLLWSNHQMKKNFQQRYDDINKNIMESVEKNSRILEALLKTINANKQTLDTGFRMMQEKYQEDRLKSTFRRAITKEDLEKT
tara:strand:+ start:250 stop:552 length:303 start_codon:yes stop_codon:yes gene_type:complete